MRKIYKFSSSLHQGGYLYAHKTLNRELIKNKEELKNALNSIIKEFELIDATIKIYDSIFFLFFMMKPRVIPIKLIDAIQEKINFLENWDEQYIYTTVYDLQKEYVRNDLKRLGFDYDKG